MGVGPPLGSHLHAAFNAARKWLPKRRSPLRRADRLLEEMIVSSWPEGVASLAWAWIWAGLAGLDLSLVGLGLGFDTLA